MLSHSKILLVSKVGISGVIASSIMLLFCGKLFFDPYGRSGMLQRRVGMSRQPLMMNSSLYDMSTYVP